MFPLSDDGVKTVKAKLSQCASNLEVLEEITAERGIPSAFIETNNKHGLLQAPAEVVLPMTDGLNPLPGDDDPC